MPKRTRHNKKRANPRKSRKQRARKQRGGEGEAYKIEVDKIYTANFKHPQAAIFSPNKTKNATIKIKEIVQDTTNSNNKTIKIIKFVEMFGNSETEPLYEIKAMKNSDGKFNIINDGKTDLTDIIEKA